MKNKFNFAQEIIKEAAAFLRAHCLDDLQIVSKTHPTDLVTQFDSAVQQNLIARIHQAYPHDHILAEEDGIRHDIKDGAVWVIDPIDGTNNFIAQQADFAVMIAFYQDGQGQFGLIYDVGRDLLYAGGGDFPVTCNGQLLDKVQDRAPERSLLAINAGIYRENSWGLTDFADLFLGVRVYGSAGISFSKVLTGSIWGYVSYICPWDYAAAKILGQALGYTTMTVEGEDPSFDGVEAIIMLPSSYKESFLAQIRK